MSTMFLPPREHTIDDDDDGNGGGNVSTSIMFLPLRKCMIQDRYGTTPQQNGGDIDFWGGMGMRTKEPQGEG